MRLLVLGAGYVGAKVAEVALERRPRGRARRQLVGQPVATSSRGSSGAARASRPWTSATRRGPRLLATPFDRVHLLAAQASRPLSISDPGYTEQTNLVGPRARGGGARRGRRADRGRVRKLSARVWARPAWAGGRGPAVRAAGRPRAPLEDLRRALPRAVRAQARLRPRAAAARDRVRPRPGGARASRVADGRRQVPPARRGRRAAAAGRRRAGHDGRRARGRRRADPAGGARRARDLGGERGCGDDDRARCRSARARRAGRGRARRVAVASPSRLPARAAPTTSRRDS